jgi:hypothetical protein
VLETPFAADVAKIQRGEPIRMGGGHIRVVPALPRARSCATPAWVPTRRARRGARPRATRTRRARARAPSASGEPSDEPPPLSSGLTHVAPAVARSVAS